MKSITAALVGFLLLIGASVYGQPEREFVGCWDWAGTRFADGTSETPSDLGYDVQLCFHPDFTFERYHHGVPVEISTWGVGCFNAGSYFIEFLWAGSGGDWLWSVQGVLPMRELNLFDTMELPDGSGSPPSYIQVYFYRGTVSVDPVSWGTLKATYR
ncbi:hypothetical protein DRQ50_05715 [bacterium]|nr:MAG: hypothetical protein DRQ50_05715 [bacterium]